MNQIFADKIRIRRQDLHPSTRSASADPEDIYVLSRGLRFPLEPYITFS